MTITMNDAVRGIEKLIADYGHIVYREALSADTCDYTLMADEFYTSRYRVAADPVTPRASLGVSPIQFEINDWEGEVVVACAVGRVLYDQGFPIEMLVLGGGSLLMLAGAGDEGKQNDPGDPHNNYGSNWAAPTAESIEILARRYANLYPRTTIDPQQRTWDIDKDAAVVLQCMQTAQDHGWSWASSGQAALSAAALIEADRQGPVVTTARHPQIEHPPQEKP